MNQTATTVVDLLHRTLYTHGVLVRLAGDRSKVALDAPDGREVPAAVRDSIIAHEAEVIEHLRGSPGSGIVGYPPELALASHAFQRIRLSERRRRHKVVDGGVGGATATTWYSDPPDWRMREIAIELGLQ